MEARGAGKTETKLALEMKTYFFFFPLSAREMQPSLKR